MAVFARLYLDGVKPLPGVDEVLGHTDVGRRACDGDMAHSWAICGPRDLDLSARHLANLVDFASLSADYAANELTEQTAEPREQMWSEKERVTQFGTVKSIHLWNERPVRTATLFSDRQNKVNAPKATVIQWYSFESHNNA